jgi:hypothetical protein
MGSSTALAPERFLDWNALAQCITLNIIDTLKAEVTFMNATMICEQCRHAYRILRIESSLAIPSAMIGRIRRIGRTLVKCHFKKGIDSMDPPRNGRPSFLSHE